MHEITDLAGLMERHAPADGFHDTALPRVRLIRSSIVTTPMPTVYVPSLCLVAQGAKEAQLGERRFRYDAANFLLGAIDLPVTGAVTRASGDAPYLCLCLFLDLAVLADLLAEHPLPAGADERPSLGLMLGGTTPSLVDAACRLLSLLDTPEDAGPLAPLIERELLWRLLRGPAGRMLCQMARSDGRGEQVHRAVRWLRRHFADPVSVEQLAELAGMSPSAFHQHFKTVTGLSPLRYRTQLRLQEARRLMIARGLDAASAGFEVGYGSPSQFSRDYARAFGLPPGRDVERLRSAGGYSAAA